MNDEIIALIGAAVLAFIVRFFNVVLAWLSRVLGVQPPDAIPTAATKLPGSDPISPVAASGSASAPDGPPIDTERPPT